MPDFECAAGCSNRGVEASQTLTMSPVPPEGWITLGLDIASAQPPYQFRDGRYSAIVCSLDCAITFLSRQKRLFAMDVTPAGIGSNIHVREETRSDITRRIGALILEAIDEMPDDGRAVLIPLDRERDQLHRNVAIGLLSFDTLESDTEEIAEA